MVNKEDLLNDKRFYIDEANAERITRRPISSYQLTELSVGKILRYLDSRIFPLYETDAYRYMIDSANEEARKQYQYYCDNFTDETEERSEEIFNSLMAEMRSEDYDPEKGIIIVDQFNFIVDGQHRCCVLLDKYGPNYVIKVLKIRYKDHGPKTYLRKIIYNLKNVKK